MGRWSLLVAFVVLSAAPLAAQQLSAGASYTRLSFDYPDVVAHGVGGWFSWDAADRGASVGFDASVSVFPDDDALIGRQALVLAGVRGGLRTQRLGVFARARPGVVRFTERFLLPDTACILIFPPPESCLTDTTNVTLDLGGTLEVYPTPRTLMRFDAGNTLVRFARTQQDAVWKHNLQIAAGGGLRF